MSRVSHDSTWTHKQNKESTHYDTSQGKGVDKGRRNSDKRRSTDSRKRSNVNNRSSDYKHTRLYDNALPKKIIDISFSERLNDKDLRNDEFNKFTDKNNLNSFTLKKLNILKLHRRISDKIRKKTVDGREVTAKKYDANKISKRSGATSLNKTLCPGQRLKWRWNSALLVTLIVLNIAGQSNAMEALSSRMIASFLGYPTTCNLGTEVRPCTLSLTCWLQGGTRLKGCGGWLFSCCGPPEPSRDGFDNSIQSSDWKYKYTVAPPKLRQVPQRSAVPNNVFRRRVDDDNSQMDCGLPASRILQKRIIGGREARFAEFPWQAHVRISEFQCGGVLVSRRFVATAAHCVSRAHTRDIAVWLGAVDTSATHHPAQKLRVAQKILHPLFQFRMTQPDRYDIALLKLSRPITYSSYILPICLPDFDLELRGRSGVIAGWGKTDASGAHTGTNLLRSATVPILSKEQCINWHQSKLINVEIHTEMICAGHSDGHQDACLGDSGGPLIVLDGGRYYLVGITSAGFGCGVDHQPGIYHNVQRTAPWIRGVISPSVNYIDI